LLRICAAIDAQPFWKDTMKDPTVSDYEMRRLLALNIGRKSVIIAFILWFFFGLLGVHRFYLDKIGTGIMMALLSIIGGMTAPILIGIPLLVIVGIWWLIDFFTIFFAARRHNRLHDELSRR
jgi:TM2 domain-containing membrane protein YozV